MNRPTRVPAVLAYLIPVFGWLYVLVFERKNELAVYHLRQAIGLFLFLLGVAVSWGVIAWLLVWIPLGVVVGMSLFTLVIAAYMYGVVAWILGMVNAWGSRAVPLPLFGRWASRLPIR